MPKTKLGKANVVVKGKNICIIGCGNILINAQDAINNLNKKNISRISKYAYCKTN